MASNTEKALRLASYLKFETGLEVVIAGGSARDTALGQTPKDYDICILGKPSDAVAWAADEEFKIAEALFKLGASYKAINHENAGEQSDEAEAAEFYRAMCTEDRLAYVIQGEFEDIKFDIIRYVLCPETPQAQVELFDCTINRCWFEGDYKNAVQDPPTEVVLGAGFSINPVRPHAFRVSNWPARKAYLQRKYPLVQFSDEAV